MPSYGIVLAAGLGKRMKSKLYKVLHPVCGKAMVEHVTDHLRQAGVSRIVTVVGHGAEAVKSQLGDRSEFVLQAEQLGTGHAVKQAETLLGAQDGTTVVICGDTPLVSDETIRELITHHENNQAAGTILTAELDNPTGYGRIIRASTDGSVLGIREEKDCNDEEAAINEINTGTYCFDNRKLFQALQKVNNENEQGEFYLTDVISILEQAGDRVEGYTLKDHAEAIGVNDRVALAEAERLMRERILRRHLLNGVTIIDPAHTYIETDVTIGQDSVIYPNTFLYGKTQIGENCQIGPNVELKDTTLNHEVIVKQSVLTEAIVGDQSVIGPFAYLRPGTVIDSRVKIGDFVEVKNSHVGEGTKIPHLAYVGDASIGRGSNLGCGVITANYDGVNKHRTEIGNDVFVGSNVNLVAPVKVGDGAFVVAGSTITKDVPKDSMAIARSRQTNKPDYATKLKNRLKTNTNGS